MKMQGYDDKVIENMEEEIEIHEAQIREYLAEIIKTNPLKLSKFIASNLQGEQYEFVRKAILLTAVSEDRVARGRIHTLLVGAPGSGKTEILLWLKQHLGAYFVNAEYASKVGLAGDARGAMITPGVLAEADGMILAIDELDKMSWRDQSALLQAMEEGAYTIVKGKHRARFRARVRVVAAANDINKIQKPLLDRFDFVITLNVPKREERAEHVREIVRQFFEGEEMHAEIINDLLSMVANFTPSVENQDKIASVLREYIKLTQLNVEEKSVRSLELSILRIANALAKLSMSNITPMTVVEAIRLKDPTLTNTQIAFLKMIARS
jgi:Predicted ATPase involved in replication control, Cdc46/Mcm family